MALLLGVAASSKRLKQGGAGRGDDDKENRITQRRISCFSLLAPTKVAENAYNQQKDLPRPDVADDLGDTSRDEEGIKASVLLISGCQDNQLSGDLKSNGLFTTRLKQVWDDGKFNRGQETAELPLPFTARSWASCL